MNKKMLIYLILVTFLCLCTYVNAFDSKVKAVIDGDTLLVLMDNNGREFKVRLYGIDAPELKQEFGIQSKENLTHLCLGKKADINIMDADRYGRLVSVVKCNNIDVNLHQLQNGLAWAYERYLDDLNIQEMYTNAQKEAFKANKGLWSSQTPIAPWDFRRK